MTTNMTIITANMLTMMTTMMMMKIKIMMMRMRRRRSRRRINVILAVVNQKPTS